MDIKGLEMLKDHEGFRGLPYNDSLGFPTIGYGTLLPLSKEEATYLLQSRLNKLEKELIKLSWYNDQPIEIRNVLQNMAYNLGTKGLLKFKKTLLYLKNREYSKASTEMLNSLWAKQVGHRAIVLSSIVRKCQGM